MVCIVLEGDTAEKERYDAGHGKAVGEEVTCVGAQGNETRFNGGIEVEIGVFEHERCC